MRLKCLILLAGVALPWLLPKAAEEFNEPSQGNNLVFFDPKDKAYLSITGRACVMRDAAKTKVVWRKSYGGPTGRPIQIYA
jgi:hypothetical protein